MTAVYWRVRAQQRWGERIEITGAGRWACRSKSPCFANRVSLHHTLEDARQSVRDISHFDFVDLSVDPPDFWETLKNMPEVNRD